MGGFELLPHTADVLLTAHGSTREECIAQAVLGLTSCFADTRGVTPDGMVDVQLGGRGGADLLAQILEEVLYLADTQNVAVITATVGLVAGDTVHLQLAVASLSTVEVTGSAPKGVSRNGLRLEPAGSGWQSSAIIDV